MHPAAFATAGLPPRRGCDWTSLSLFSGGGGLDLGFLAEGVEPVAAYDNSRAALSAYRQNLGDFARLADISTYTPRDCCQVMLAGAPCQGFSTAGRRALLDPRNALLRRVADICLEVRPRVLIVENVPAALSGDHGNLWVALEDRVRLAGYNVARIELRGEESGVAQRRRRLFLVAWLGSGCVRMDIPVIEHPGLEATLAGVDDIDAHAPIVLDPDDSRYAIAEAIPAGAKLCNVRRSDRAIPTWAIPGIFGETSEEERQLLATVSVLRRRARKRSFGDGDPVPVAVLETTLGRGLAAEIARLVDVGYLRFVDGDVELKSTYNGKFRRLSWEELSPTVDTRFGRPENFLHPEEHRGFSVREAARVQGFPDAYQLCGSTKESYEIVGNAVPPPMSARLAAFVREALLKAQ